MEKKRRRIKDRYKKILKRMQHKLGFVFLVVCVLFVVLIGRIAMIEYSSGDKYQRIILSQQEYDSSIIPYQRGDITDIHGTVLATSVDVYNVILDAKVLNANEDAIESTFLELGACFPEIDIEAARAILTDDPKSQYNILAKRVSYEEMHNFTEIMNEQNKDAQEGEKKIVGVWFEKEYKRQYPYDSLASHLLGFTTSGNLGMNGIELSYNDVLNGTNGRSYGYVNTDSDVENTVVEPVNGNTIVSTIDVNIQSIVEQEILNWNQAHASDGSLGSKHTGLLVMNPQDGSVLAMASYPTYNLNDPWNLEGIYTQDELDGMDNDTEMDALNNLWQNFCITSTYEPGSTFKPFTVACGLDTGALTGNESYYCDGVEEISGFGVHCFKRAGHGQLDVRQAVMESCNDALMQMSYSIGPADFAKYQRLFGFGQRTGIDLPGEARTDGLIYNEEQLDKTINLATNSFGQNFNTTMIQLGSAFCSLINGGNLYQPRVVDHVVDDAGNVVQSYDAILQKKTISEDTSEMIKSYLRDTVADGTGIAASIPGYDLGGKTGTAQKVPRSAGTYLVSFIGYLPQDNPEILIYCCVDEPNCADQARSSYSMEILRNVLVQILPYMGIEPNTEPTEAEVKQQQDREAEAAAAAAATESEAATGTETGTETDVEETDAPATEENDGVEEVAAPTEVEE